MGFLDFNNLFEDFKRKCRKIIPFAKTRKGQPLCIAALVIFIMLFFAPLFHGGVGTALVGCVAAPYLVLLWRKFRRELTIVPSVFYSLVMLLDMILYHSLTVVSWLLTAIVFLLLIAISENIFKAYDNLEDGMYTYIGAGVVCVIIVIIACLVAFLVSIAWWLLCLVAFLAVIGIFFSVVLSTAAYTATDDKRQARKKYLERQQKFDRETYTDVDYTDIDD